MLPYHVPSSAAMQAEDGKKGVKKGDTRKASLGSGPNVSSEFLASNVGAGQQLGNRCPINRQYLEGSYGPAALPLPWLRTSPQEQE